jgi:hypothetical protein
VDLTNALDLSESEEEEEVEDLHDYFARRQDEMDLVCSVCVATLKLTKAFAG